MKFGCMGCLILLLILAVALLGGAAALYFGGSFFETPVVQRVEYSPEDGYRAQQKIFDLVAREREPSSRRESVVLTEREINAFVARHLDEREGIPLSPLVVKLTPGRIEILGRTMAGNLFQSLAFSRLAQHLPATALEQPVWVTVGGTIEVQQRRSPTEREYARFAVSDFSVGYQNLGPWILWLMMGEKEDSLLRWPLPATVESISVERGRLVIATR